MPFEIVRNDITKMNVDAIVNAANSSLLGGGGVDGAIHKAAGPALLEECRALGGCETGEAKITKGYLLPAKYVIHTVGPVWQGGSNGEKEQLTACYENSLALALSHHCETVAFPLISAGSYGYPKDEAMSVAVGAITRFLLDHDMTVYLVVFGPAEFMTSKKLFRDVQEYIDDVYAENHILSNRRASTERQWGQVKAHFSKSRPPQRAAESDERRLETEIGSAAASLFDDPESLRMEEDSTPFTELVKKEQKRMEGAALSGHRQAAPITASLEELLKKTDESFSQALLRLIDEKGLTDTQCYKKANVDRKHFSKIRSNPTYKPSKPTVLAFAVALELTLPESVSLLRKAGFALTHSSKFDIILEYCIKNRIFDIYEINEVLFQFDMPLLGSSIS